jgi:hypothetical protein
LLSESASFSELSFLPNGTDIAGGIGSPGAIFYNVAALQSCTATGNVVSQGSLQRCLFRPLSLTGRSPESNTPVPMAT